MAQPLSIYVLKNPLLLSMGSVNWSLSEKFLELCKKFSVGYNAFIVTNASLMEDSDVEFFKKYKIKGAQVTIDGVKEIHDSRRRNITNESTFDKLIDRVDELLDVLVEKIECHAELKIGLGQVAAYTDIRKSIESDRYNNDQFADVMLPLYKKFCRVDLP